MTICTACLRTSAGHGIAVFLSLSMGGHPSRVLPSDKPGAVQMALASAFDSLAARLIDNVITLINSANRRLIERYIETYKIFRGMNALIGWVASNR